MSTYITKMLKVTSFSVFFILFFSLPSEDLAVAQVWTLCDQPGQAHCWDDIGPTGGWAYCYGCGDISTCDCGGVYPIYCGSYIDCFCPNGCWGAVICSGTCIIIG